MPISFNQIPSGNLLPFIYMEFDNTGAVDAPSEMPWAVLLIGQKTATGTATPLEIVQITADGQGNNLFGDGSMLSREVEAYRSRSGRVPMYCLPLEDDATAVARVATLTYSGTATESGEEVVYIGGKSAKVGVAKDDAAADVVADLVIAINAISNCPVTASAVGAVLTLTFKNAGAQSNQIQVSTDYRGEKGAPGLSVVIADATSGATDPDLVTLGVVGILGDNWYQVICQPYQDDTNMDYIDNELTDRWGPIRRIEGIQFTAKNDTFTNVQTWGAGKNSPFTCAINSSNFQTPPEELAAEMASEVALAAQIDPARPFQTLDLLNALPPKTSERNTNEENSILLAAGVSTLSVDMVGDTVRIQRALTTYKYSATGATDPSYRNVNTIYTSGYIRFDFRTHMATKFPRHKLASDGANFGVGQAVITPSVGKSEALFKFRQWELAGLVENIEGFKKGLIVERNQSDFDRLDFLMTPDYMNQFRIAGIQVKFFL